MIKQLFLPLVKIKLKYRRTTVRRVRLSIKSAERGQIVTIPIVLSTELIRMAKMHTGAIHLTIIL